VLDSGRARACIDRTWDHDVLPALEDYIRIPNVSVAFDPDWEAHGHMARAVEVVRGWCAARPITGATVRLHELPGRTPLVVVDVPALGGPADDTVLLYGHLDKQPPFTGWRDGLDPWTPVLEGERLYGRGSADDGYAAFSALTALEAVQAAEGAHARCVVVIEASEESGSIDLPAHLAALGDDVIGTPSLVIGLDSSCGDWEHFWLTTSLRGIVQLELTVRVLTEGVHSGSAGGVVPSSFRVLRRLLDRIEDPDTGELLVPALHVPLPEERARQIEEVAPFLADLLDRYPFADAVRPQHDDLARTLAARTWEPALEVIGLDGAPAPRDAGNVLRPWTTAKLSLRVPPGVDARAAGEEVARVLTDAPPYGAHVTCEVVAAESGWAAPPTAPWLVDALDAAARAAFGGPVRANGEGGTIPFMGMLGERFPDAQFVITGVLGPGANAHGPNEFLDLPTARRVTHAVAHLVDAHARR
jgi:acetylornithine deacetylase/succinyl-diaminopimelate desuccinylase-like protein